MRRTAFTMIELIFVIVILGIMAAVALPKMGGVVDSSHIASAKGDVSGIRAAIASARQKQLVRGRNKYLSKLSTLAGSSNNGDLLFDGNGTVTLLSYGIVAKHGSGWKKTSDTTYEFQQGTATAVFTYDPAKGLFDCDHSVKICRSIVE